MNETISALLHKAEIILAQGNIENPRLAAEIILRSILKLRRIDLYLEPERLIDTKTVEIFETMIARKLNREPLQYIVGETEWFGLTLKCDRRALIPRPETEIILEKALHVIKEIPTPTIADIGTGTGAIALAIATSRSDSTVVATDSSQEALSLAQENIALHQLTDRITLRHGNLMEVFGAEERFDIIISNPPYVRTGEFDTLMPEVREFEPAQALLAGDDGLDVIRKLISRAFSFLKPDRFLVLEFGVDHAEPISLLARDSGVWEIVEIIIDYNQRERGMILKLK